MRIDGIFEVRPLASLLSCLTLSLSIGTVTAAEIQSPVSRSEPRSEPIEEIEVTGRPSLLALRAEIVSAEARMFDMFNELNTQREFEVSCEVVMITTSRIRQRKCVPVYMKRAEQTNVQKFLFSDLTPPDEFDTVRAAGGKSFDIKGVQESEEQLWFRNEPKHRELEATFRELASQHPELASAALELETKRERLAELEEQQRKEGVVGRFFSRFGGRDEE